MSSLEQLSFVSPAEFLCMILFGMSSMILSYSVLNLPPRLLGHNLSTFFVYLWARSHEGMEVSVMDLFMLKAEMLPWFFMLQTFLLEGELPVLDLLGVLFGHLFFHLQQTGVVRAPSLLKKWYEEGTDALALSLREQYKSMEDEVRQ